MKIPGFDMEGMMRQVQNQQADMQRALENERIEVTSGGGMVTVVMNSLKHLISIKIDESVFKDGDREMLQDLIVAAVNEAERKADDNTRRYATGLLGGMGLGGLL